VASTPPVTGLQNSPPPPITAGNGSRPGAVATPQPRLAAEGLRRRLDRGAVGFWLGGVALGIGGCVLGGCAGYRHPAGLAGSAFWWGLYAGCLGAGIGTLLGLWANRTQGAAARRGAGGGVDMVGAQESLPTPPEAGAGEGNFTPIQAIWKWPRYVPLPARPGVGPTGKAEPPALFSADREWPEGPRLSPDRFPP
jgi:hypothetical protein